MHLLHNQCNPLHAQNCPQFVSVYHQFLYVTLVKLEQECRLEKNITVLSGNMFPSHTHIFFI
uniref:Uncharacterized protein n=1 Tax=Arundo donax TaxID=35708 RepID=A0A0A9FJG2_ARUDO